MSVKAGKNAKVAMIRDLHGVIKGEGAGNVVFSPSPRPMITKAARAGLCQIKHWNCVPRIQIVTVADAKHLRERAINLPNRTASFKPATSDEVAGLQKSLDL